MPVRIDRLLQHDAIALNHHIQHDIAIVIKLAVVVVREQAVSFGNTSRGSPPTRAMDFPNRLTSDRSQPQKFYPGPS
jgi:hypothetical protein